MKNSSEREKGNFAEKINFYGINAFRLIYKAFRPLMGPKACRFYPSCSEYSFSALEKHGIFKGGFISAKRILKCHPFHPGGYDPLP